MGSRTAIRSLAACFGLAAMASLPAVSLAGAGPAAAAAPPGGRMVPAIDMGSGPLVHKIGGPDRSGGFSCQSAAASVPCYGPAQIRAAYDIPRNLTGAGRTVVIIDAFRDPTIRTDVAEFDSTFGLPRVALNIICPGRHCPTFDPTSIDQVGWTNETSLDIEWVHAIAPRARIDLVLAQSDDDADILFAQQYVADHDLGDVLSQSFGEGETCMEPSLFSAQHQAFVLASREKMTVFAAAGDSGAAQGGCVGGAFFDSVGTPASDPLVTAVGGTHLDASLTTGAYHAETVWNNPARTPTSAPAAAASAPSTRGRPTRTPRTPAAASAACPMSPTTRTSTAACWVSAPNATSDCRRSPSSAAPAPERRSGRPSRRSPIRRPGAGSAR